jgi:hypothetical protein
MGDKLGLYKAINEQGPMTPEELATKMNVAERYARVALPPGSIGVSRIRACHRQVHRTGGTGNGVRRALTVPSICREVSISRRHAGKAKHLRHVFLVGKDQDIVVIIDIGQCNNVIHPFGGRSCGMSPAGYMRLMGLPHHDEMI